MWPDTQVADLVRSEFIPVRVHVRDQAQEFERLGSRYGAEWTPTTLVLSPDGQERHRVEGFLPAEELVPQLEFGLAQTAFQSGSYGDAEERFREIVSVAPEADVAPEALYWAGVSRFKKTNESEALERTFDELSERYPRTLATKKASVWRRGAGR